MRITALLENTTDRADMRVEHGLSLYIESSRHRILFDMGQTDLFCQNARTLGIDLSKVDLAILSHGHYDHGGGLRTFLEINKHAPVYVHREAFLPHYNASGAYIGLDRAMEDHPRLVATAGTCRIDQTVTLDDCNGRERRHGFGSFGLTEQTEAGVFADAFRHEQYLLLEEEGRRILISGCSHKGILDLAEWFMSDVLIGGFHFSKLPLNGSLTRIAEALAAHNTEFFTCHCTGREQYAFMRPSIPHLRYLSCGMTLEL